MSAAYTGEVPEREWPRLLARAEPRPVHALEYSNLGYNVAAMAIDAVRPEGWKRYLEDAVYRPAGLVNTFARVSDLNDRRVAKPHRWRADGRYETDTFFKTDATMNAAGGHLSTMGDLARWTIVQMDGGRIDGRQVFPAEAVMLSPSTAGEAHLRPGQAVRVLRPRGLGCRLGPWTLRGRADDQPVRGLSLVPLASFASAAPAHRRRGGRE